MTDNEMKKRIEELKRKVAEIDNLTDNESLSNEESRRITNKQANIFYRFDQGKPFIHIYNGRRFDRLGANYRVSFSALVVPKI